MNWSLIVLMAVVVLFSRYFFLEPKLPFVLNKKNRDVLEYAAPAVLAAVIGPIIFVRNGEANFDLLNPYLIGSLVAVTVMVFTKNTLKSALLSMIVFIAL